MADRFLPVKACIDMIKNAVEGSNGGSVFPEAMLEFCQSYSIVEKREEKCFKCFDCRREKRDWSIALALVGGFPRFIILTIF